MAAELFFIYDTHCPWSYATTPLVNAIAEAFPEITIQLFPSARYQGDEHIPLAVLDGVTRDSKLKFNPAYLAQLSRAVDSTLATNLMAWTSRKTPLAALPLLNALQQAHFIEANALATRDDVASIIDSLKLSPPAKVFTLDKFSGDAQVALQHVQELQEVMGTAAIPALLLAIDEQLILLNHNLYLQDPETIVEAVQIELANNQ